VWVDKGLVVGILLEDDDDDEDDDDKEEAEKGLIEDRINGEDDLN